MANSVTKKRTAHASKESIKKLIKNPKETLADLNMPKIEENKMENREETKEDLQHVREDRFKSEHLNNLEMIPIRPNDVKRSAPFSSIQARRKRKRERRRRKEG